MKVKHILKIKISATISALLTWIVIGTVSFHFLESWGWIDSLYFSVATLTTVGYGDLVPTTSLSKLFAIIYILFGVAIMLALLGSIGSTILDKKRVKINNKKK